MQRSNVFIGATALLALLSSASLCLRPGRHLHDISFALSNTVIKLPMLEKEAAQVSSTTPLHKKSLDHSQFERAEDLPEWLRAFVELNHNHTTPPRPYLRYTCLGAYCGGVADRVKGLIQTFYMAMCTGRQFYIHWQTPVAVRRYFRPNLIHWNNNSKSRRAVPLVSMGKAVEQVQNPYLLNPNKSYDVKTNKWLGDEIVRNSFCMQNYLQKFDDGKDANDLFRMAFWTLFQWSPQVVQSVEAIQSELNVTRPYVAIHIRTGLVPNIKDAKRTKRQDWPLFDQCARAFQAGLREMCKGSSIPIYLASDSPESKKKLQSLDTDASLKTLTDMEIYHIDRTIAGTLSDEGEAMLDVFSDLKLLMDSTCLVMSRSGYSRLAQWLPDQPRCGAYYNDCGPERVAEELTKLEGICGTT